MKCSIKEALFKEFFFFVFIFKFIFQLHYDIHYPSLDKLRKTFIKAVKTCHFAFVQIKKM